ncbi:MAG: 5-oxoprolinase subunit PxpB [Hyphomicrobiaceae bacterium]
MPTPIETARFLPAGDTSLVVEFGDHIDRQTSDRVLALADALGNQALAGIVELVPTFRSLMIHYDPIRLDARTLEQQVRRRLDGLEMSRHAGRLWHLPCCYGGEFGPDVADVACRTGLSPEDVIRIHSGETYHIYALGFLPGYPYMGDVPDALSLPRRETPRLKVPMGSVCIAQRMAGIYSLESPGGWHLLGRTPVRLFDIRREKAVLLAPGDRIRFEVIDPETFGRLDDEAAAGTLEIQNQELDT